MRVASKIVANQCYRADIAAGAAFFPMPLSFAISVMLSCRGRVLPSSHR